MFTAVIKKSLIAFALTLALGTVTAQEHNINDTLHVDLDHDNKIDTVVLDRLNAVLRCKLSTENHAERASLKLTFEEQLAGLRKAENGFIYFAPNGHSSYYCGFVYDRGRKKIRLNIIGRHLDDPTSKAGSRRSEANLLTGEYIGEGEYYDPLKQELVKIPRIMRKMTFPKIYLENFSNDIANRYMKQCSGFLDEVKQELRAPSKKKTL